VKDGMTTHLDRWDEWINRCEAVLRGNLPEPAVRAKLPFAYTCPAREKGHYLPQWLWDSCFHALAYRWFDPQMAWDELQSLLVHQVADGDDAGMVPHMAHFAANGDTVNQQLFRHLQRSSLTQPPLIAVAAMAVYQRDPRDDMLRAMYPQLRRYHEWFDRRRDRDGDHLVAILHPWESGWDASQRWDALMGIQESQRNVAAALSQRRRELLARILDCSADIEMLVRSAEHFIVKPADFNAIRAADLDALAAMAAQIGEAEDAAKLGYKANLVRDAIRRQMITAHNGMVQVVDLGDVSGIPRVAPLAVTGVLLFAGCLPAEEASYVRDALVADAASIPAGYQVPTTPVSHPQFDGDEYWRGNVWLPVNWLIYCGLSHYGFTAEAAFLAQRSLDLVERSGFAEFFNPLTGARGSRLGVLCPERQSWSTIVLDMLGQERARRQMAGE
jgi:glycogen debranching enzyme